MAIDPFLWQQPLQDAYGFRRPPAPRRLSLDDLLAMQQQFQPTPRPQQARSVADLDQQDRRGVRQQSVIQGLAALGAAMQTNDWRYAGQGAADIAGMQQQAVEGANVRAEEEWKAEQERRAREIEQEQRQGQQAALFGVYEKIAQAEPPGSRLTEKAEAAARAGSMAELQGLLGEVPRRQAARSKGYDPDSWDTAERMQQELAAELERQKAAAAWQEEQKRLAEKEAIEAEAELNARLAQRDKGVLWEPRESPAEAAARARAVAEAQESVRDRYRDKAAGGAFAGGRLFEQGNDTIVYAVPPTPENPRGQIIPLMGPVERVGELEFFTLAGGIRMMHDPKRPDIPAVEVPTKRRGQAGYDDAYQTLTAPPSRATAPVPTPTRPAPTPQDREKGLHWRNRATLSLEAGASEADVLALLRSDKKDLGGYTPEQVLAEAKAQAERRRKGGRP